MEQLFDVIIVGGGVVGCAVLNKLTLQGYRCCLLEKEDHLLTGASSGNSGMVHTGFDATPGSKEFECLKDVDMLLEMIEMHQVPYKQIGAIMVAWDEEQKNKLCEVEVKARQSGICKTRLLSQEELRVMEPNLNRRAVAGLFIPDEAVVDSWMLPVKMAHQAVQNGALVHLGCKVQSGRQTSDASWELMTNHGLIRGRVVVNAAGLFGDDVQNICHPSQLSIKPRKGQFIVYGKEAGDLLNHIILPIPTNKSKGILVNPSVYGNLVVGPTAENCIERDQPKFSDDITKMLMEFGESVVPQLARHKVFQSYCGLRPATDNKDYFLEANPSRNWVTVGGIRSTGVSSCVAIAARVLKMTIEELHLSPSSTTTGKVLGQTVPIVSTGGRSIRLDGIEYTITHPLSQVGLGELRSKI